MTIAVNWEVKHQHFFELEILNIVLPISFNICYGCSKEPSDRSMVRLFFKHPQHMFWLRNEKKYFLLRPLN